MKVLTPIKKNVYVHYTIKPFNYMICAHILYKCDCKKLLQNTRYPKGGRFCEGNFLMLLIGSQSIIEGGFLLICGRRG